MFHNKAFKRCVSLMFPKKTHIDYSIKRARSSFKRRKLQNYFKILKNNLFSFNFKIKLMHLSFVKSRMKDRFHF